MLLNLRQLSNQQISRLINNTLYQTNNNSNLHSSSSFKFRKHSMHSSHNSIKYNPLNNKTNTHIILTTIILSNRNSFMISSLCIISISKNSKILQFHCNSISNNTNNLINTSLHHLLISNNNLLDTRISSHPRISRTTTTIIIIQEIV